MSALTSDRPRKSRFRKLGRQLRNRRIRAHRWLYKQLRIVARELPYDNIYHCCTQRTGSQWFRHIFSDPIVYRYTGLDVVRFIPLHDEWKYADCNFDMELPKRTIALHLYIGYPTYGTIPKPAAHRTFFMMRDPRDLVVSWYFSTRYSHVPMGYIPEYRKILEKMDKTEGLKHTIDVLQQGIFPMQRSWARAPESADNIRVLRYEDLSGDNRMFLRQLFDYLDIELPEREFAALYERHRFEKKAQGRPQGSEDQWSHYRKGVAGDWKNHFDASIASYFRQETGDLLDVLGYAG